MKKEITNFEYIKSLKSPIEFVDLLLKDNFNDPSICSICYTDENCNDDCRGGIEKWLNEEFKRDTKELS